MRTVFNLKILTLIVGLLVVIAGAALTWKTDHDRKVFAEDKFWNDYRMYQHIESQRAKPVSKTAVGLTK